MNLKAEDLLRRIQSQPGTEIGNGERLRQDMKQLATLAWRSEARIELADGGARLIFVLSENPTLEEIRFIGNSKIEIA